MKLDPLEIMADGIMAYEGWHAGSRSYRNRNPGNLRYYKESQAHDSGGYRIFDSLLEGYSALLNDLTAKFNGSHGLSQESSLLDLMEIYAPAADANHPRQYASYIAQWLSLVFHSVVRPETTLGTIQNLTLGDL